MAIKNNSIPGVELQIEWRFKVSEQEEICLKVDGDVLTVTAHGPHKDFEHSMTLESKHAHHLVSLMITPALECVGTQHREQIKDAVAFLFMGIGQICAPGVCAQIVNSLIG